MKKSILIILLSIIIFTFCNSVLYADFWDDANDWYNGTGFSDTDDIEDFDKTQVGNISTIAPSASEVIDTFSDMINLIGTTVIVIVTIFLGIKYMFGSFEEKADVKTSLINLLVACILFFGWNSIWQLLFENGSFVLNPSGNASYKTIVGSIFSTLANMANFLAVGAVLYIGIKYILAGAKGKADLKAKSGNFILGIILAFCSVGFLNLVSTIVNEIFTSAG